MRFHVISLPHTNTTRAYDWCAYTGKVRKFCDMMTARGHTVYLYAGEDNEANVAELIPCITRHEQEQFFPEGMAEFIPGLPYWTLMNSHAIAAIQGRAEVHDVVCHIAGLCQQPIAQALPGMLHVEFGIGYGGTFADFRVFESYAWMHTVYGHQQGTHSADGRYYDAVIPNYFDVNDFTFQAEKGDYFMYLGRLIDRKGVQVAADVCKHLDARLVVAGDGPNPPNYGELVGLVGVERRAELLAGAKALFVPTQYVEPFGGVAIEAMLSGTPVIPTDWGAFTETVSQGETGFRCRTLAEFVDAARHVGDLDPCIIAKKASRYSMEVVGEEYETYFDRLAGLWGTGWSAL